MLRILGRTTSINVRKALVTADELALDYAHEAEWGVSRDVRSTEYLAWNPNGLMPVLLGAGEPLWESHAIMRLMAMGAERTELLGGDARGQAAVAQWMDWLSMSLNPTWMPAFHGLIRGNPRFSAPEVIAESTRAWNGAMAVLEAQLARTGAWVTGETFTLADIALGLGGHRWRATPIERAEMPAVRAWLARLDARPAFARYATPDLP